MDKLDMTGVINPMTIPECDEWCDALVSGKYKQGKGGLRMPDGFCCLGVEQEVHPELCSPVTGFTILRAGAASVRLPRNLQLKLADMNDEWGWTFGEIADHIRANIRDRLPEFRA